MTGQVLNIVDIIFYGAAFIMSVVIHEVSHGLAANSLGDPTAKYEGRLTLNPIKHLDPFGSVLLPLLTYFMGGFIIGWARPVPYNPYNLKNQKWGPALVGAAGPAANITIALFFSLVIRLFPSAPESMLAISSAIVFINILLAIFNLIPIPPLDGSKVLFAFLPSRWIAFEAFLEQYGFILLFIFIFTLWSFFAPVIFWLFRILVGA